MDHALILIRVVAAMTTMVGLTSLVAGVGLLLLTFDTVDPALYSWLGFGFVVWVPFGLLTLLFSRPLARFAARPVAQAAKEK